jgi:Mrp family chromosome partitioning ATPase
MNAIDQAFIRAYEHEAPTPQHAAPPQHSMPHVGSAPPSQRPRLSGGVAPSPRPIVAAPRSVTPPVPHFTETRQPNPPSERRPLSAFAAKGPTVEAQFKPALEVDEFRWPAACERILRHHHDSLRPAVLTLMAADDAGRSLIGIGAPAPGAGCTTILACLARLLVKAGKTVAIVDANFAAPGLARQLGLMVDVGWEDVLAGNAPLAEGVVYSLADRIALLPLTAGGHGAVEQLDSIHASVTAGVLRYHYDIVLFDLGAIADRLQGAAAKRLAKQCRLDGLILTSAAAMLQPQRLMQLAPELAALCLGVVENQLRAA